MADKKPNSTRFVLAMHIDNPLDNHVGIVTDDGRARIDAYAPLDFYKLYDVVWPDPANPWKAGTVEILSERTDLSPDYT